MVQTVQLSNSDDQAVRVFLTAPQVGASIKKALEEALAMRAKLAQAQREAQQVQRALAQLEADQERLRKNLKEMPPTAAAYKRYLEKFDAQETEIEKLQSQEKQLRTAAEEAQKEFETYVAGLTVE